MLETAADALCSGLSVSSWCLKSVYLSTHEITYLQMAEHDIKELLETLLEMRLGEEAIKKVSSGTSTQKCEAFNRSTSKEVNFPKTFEGICYSVSLLFCHFVIIQVFLNILKTDGPIETKFFVHIVIDKIYVGIVNLCFSQICNGP